MSKSEDYYIHPTADVSADASISPGVRIWHHAQVRENSTIGTNCIVGKGVYIDHGVSIGANSKLQNGALVYHGANLGEGVFIGPNAILANDRLPRAITPAGELKTIDDWQVSPTVVKRGASIGAQAVILPGLVIGEFAMVGAGSVVTRDVPDLGLVYGNPAVLQGLVCRCGNPLPLSNSDQLTCPQCESHEPT